MWPKAGQGGLLGLLLELLWKRGPVQGVSKRMSPDLALLAVIFATKIGEKLSANETDIREKVGLRDGEGKRAKDKLTSAKAELMEA